MLESMEAQLRSEEAMVMDPWKDAKRFQATVGYIADTRLKDATHLGGCLFFFFGVSEAD